MCIYCQAVACCGGRAGERPALIRGLHWCTAVRRCDDPADPDLACGCAGEQAGLAGVQRGAVLHHVCGGGRRPGHLHRRVHLPGALQDRLPQDRPAGPPARDHRLQARPLSHFSPFLTLASEATRPHVRLKNCTSWMRSACRRLICANISAYLKPLSGFRNLIALQRLACARLWQSTVRQPAYLLPGGLTC